MAGFRFPARISKVDERVTRAGGNERLHQDAARAHRSLREATGRRGTRASEVLRDGIYAERVCQPSAGRKSFGAADED